MANQVSLEKIGEINLPTVNGDSIFADINTKIGLQHNSKVQTDLEFSTRKIPLYSMGDNPVVRVGDSILLDATGIDIEKINKTIQEKGSAPEELSALYSGNIIGITGSLEKAVKDYTATVTELKIADQLGFAAQEFVAEDMAKNGIDLNISGNIQISARLTKEVEADKVQTALQDFNESIQDGSLTTDKVKEMNEAGIVPVVFGITQTSEVAVETSQNVQKNERTIKR